MECQLACQERYIHLVTIDLISWKQWLQIMNWRRSKWKCKVKPSKPWFLESVRKLCDQKNIVLIFDECTSGFRETFGGIHLKYGVEPDMAMFGKALGNGYAITATIGKKEIMQAAQNTFISSTFWTERIGPAAALKTLEVMEQCRSWEKITNTGNMLKNKWHDLAVKHGLEIEFNGIAALIGFDIKSENHLNTKHSSAKKC